MSSVYLFSVTPETPPVESIESGEEVSLIVRGAFADVEDIRTIPTPFTPACDGHPLAPVSGPIHVNGAEPGDAVLIDILKMDVHEDGMTAILRDFGVLRHEFADPKLLQCPVRDGKAWFADRIPVPLNPNLGTVSTMPPEGYKPSYAGEYGGDFDQKDAGVGSRIHLPVMVPGAMVFFADPHAAISDGIITGTGVECTSTVTARITLVKNHRVEHPIIEYEDSIQFVGTGPSVEAATEAAAEHAVGYVTAGTDLDREEAYMLLSIVGELRIGTSPRPIMAARLIVPRETLEQHRLERDRSLPDPNANRATRRPEGSKMSELPTYVLEREFAAPARAGMEGLDRSGAPARAGTGRGRRRSSTASISSRAGSGSSRCAGATTPITSGSSTRRWRRPSGSSGCTRSRMRTGTLLPIP